ncbi:MAG: thioredoxin domain-containing protein [Acidimicrobiales bacterium]
MNRLAQASSPYLRQHAGNPVDWYPWGEEALAAARTQDKPLFVSIGYAACHWCHVMAHESFEDPDTAADLERDFVAVKVDREERPDVDAVYMSAVQAMTGSGGWPMSVFCTPDGRPFFAGTYFPPSDRHAMPSFRRVLAAVSSAWKQRRDEVEAQASALSEALERETTVVDRLAARGQADGTHATPDPGRVLDEVVDALAARFDEHFGGFGPAPKFPRPTFVELCLRRHLRTGDAASLRMATRTLDAMAAGGIYDHVEGGFARYSTDDRWLVPHFEKMLTDQALLARSYVRAWQATANPGYLAVATETIDFVLDAMTSDDGGLCASLDADAGGVEGGHATWTPAEVRDALSRAGIESSATALCEWYSITEEGNWEHGRSVPHRPIGAPLERPPEIEAGRLAMLAARRSRPQPARDTKVLTEWNAMFVAALAHAAAACGSPSWTDRAVSLGTMLFDRHRRADGRWLRAAGTDIPAFAADYAWVVECCTSLGELTGRAVWTARAEEVAGQMLDLFFDDAAGGIFTSGSDAERLVVRAKEVVDGAVPSANALAAQALVRLGMLTGAPRWRAAAGQLLALTAPLRREQPLAVADMVVAALLDDGATEIVVSGDRPDLLAEVRSHWLPDAVLAWGEPTASPLWEGRSAPAERGAAFVCHHFTCDAPCRDPGTLRAQLVPSSRGSEG